MGKRKSSREPRSIDGSDSDASVAAESTAGPRPRKRTKKGAEKDQNDKEKKEQALKSATKRRKRLEKEQCDAPYDEDEETHSKRKGKILKARQREVELRGQLGLANQDSESSGNELESEDDGEDDGAGGRMYLPSHNIQYNSSARSMADDHGHRGDSHATPRARRNNEHTSHVNGAPSARRSSAADPRHDNIQDLRRDDDRELRLNNNHEDRNLRREYDRAPRHSHPDRPRTQPVHDALSTITNTPAPQVTNVMAQGTPSSRRAPESENDRPDTVSTTAPAQTVAPVDPPFRDGKIPSGRAKAHDFADEVFVVIMAAIRRYEAHICTRNAFPSQEQQAQWVQESWSAELTARSLHYKLSERVKQVIKGGGSHARGQLKERTRALVSEKYGFVENTGRASDKAKNRERLAVLLKDFAFMFKACYGSSFPHFLCLTPSMSYQDPDMLTGFAEHKILLAVIRSAWFRDSRDAGVLQPEYFNPITAETIALVYTTVMFCLQEWESGVLAKGPFTEKDNKATYKTILQEIKDWCRGNEPFLVNMGKRLYKKARIASGASPIDDGSPKAAISASIKEKAREALVSRTGDTDSEAEVEQGNSDDGGVGENA
ncbi:hypothetical protein FA95DRAFT_1662752 [Auriscalpium vulgare]|uniref:Uncharacterized protein n=1 Tax=Auriscalpium vulgare TaxID=40419 RepID=A0ACB8RUB2_9AGAM|nr:hypothetical protein FA95DRAFT_1662752 [Auriscalpium vulgare]